YCHSSCCSCSTAPISLVTDSRFGKIWTTSARRLISRFNRSMGLFDQIFTRHGRERDQIGLGSLEHIGDSGKRASQTLGHLLVLSDDGLPCGLGEDRRDQRVDRFRMRTTQTLGDVAGEMDSTPLPPGTG